MSGDRVPNALVVVTELLINYAVSSCTGTSRGSSRVGLEIIEELQSFDGDVTSSLSLSMVPLHVFYLKL